MTVVERLEGNSFTCYRRLGKTNKMSQDAPPEELQGAPQPDLPLRHRSTRTPPPDSNPISARFRPDSDLKKKGCFQVRIRSKSGQNRVRMRSGRRGSAGSERGRPGWEGPSSSSESLYLIFLNFGGISGAVARAPHHNLSCTRLRVPPVALHVSQLISWILLQV